MVIWSAPIAARAGLVSSMPVTLSDLTSNGARCVCGWAWSRASGVGRWKPFFGTVPEMLTALRVRLPAASWAPSSAASLAIWDAGKLSCAADMKSVRENLAPGLACELRLKRLRPFSFSSWSRSLWDRPGPSPLPSIFSGRVTDMSVPTPVSGASTLSCAWSRPAVRALTVTTRPTPTPRPCAVGSVRPLRRRNSENRYER